MCSESGVCEDLLCIDSLARDFRVFLECVVFGALIPSPSGGVGCVVCFAAKTFFMHSRVCEDFSFGKI